MKSECTLTLNETFMKTINEHFEFNNDNNKAVLEPRVAPAFAITYFCNHCKY